VVILGSVLVSRAGFGVAQKQSFSELSEREKVCDGEDTIASTRDACATQECGHSQTETTSLD